MGRKLRRLPVLVAGLALAPTAVLALLAACRAVAELGSGHRGALPFLAGLALYPLAHFAAVKPMGLYVFGHELTHGVAAVLSGARVRKMKVSSRGGHVVLDRSNAFIALAPYLIPLYTVFWLSAVRLASVWRPVPGWLLAAGVGLTLSFHFLLTAEVLWDEHQTDLDHGGGVFVSLVLILLVNSLVLVGALKGLYPGEVSLRAWSRALAGETFDFWLEAGRLAGAAATWASDRWSGAG